MPNVLVTGAAGFLGSRLITELAEKYKVYPLTKKPCPSLKNGLVCDLADPNSLMQIDALEEIEMVVHLASMVPRSFEAVQNFEMMIKNNLIATKNLCDYLPKLKHFCLASTIEVYGKPDSTPIQENYPCAPITVYGLSKLFQEQFVKHYASSKDIISTILRFTTIYGPGETFSRVIPNFIKSCLLNRKIEIFGTGDELRDFLFVDDAIKSIELAIEKRIDGVFNITGGQPISIKNLANMIMGMIGNGTDVIYNPAKQNTFNNYLSPEKAKCVLGFQSSTLLSYGLKKEIEYFKNNSGVCCGT
jgi:UDP-glucose 4-epimerase